MNKFCLVIFLVVVIFKTEAQTSVLDIADSLYLNGNYSKAIAAYNESDNPPQVSDKIAKAYLALGNYGEAINYYKISIKTNPGNSLIRYEYAKLLSKTKNYNEASEFFNQLISRDALNPNYHYELGLVEEQLKDSTAQKRFHKAFQLDQTHQKAIFKIAKYNLVKRKHNVVDSLVNIGLQSYANNKELISLKAQNYYWLTDYENAIIWFEKLISLKESSQFIHEKLSFCYTRVHNYPKAISNQLTALKYDSNNANNLYALGQLYEWADDFINAEKYIRLSLEIQDQPLDIEYSKLAFVLNRQEKYADAIEILKTAINENPKNISTQFFLLTTKDKYYADLDSKITLYENFIKKHPKSTFIRFSEHRLKELKEEKFNKKD